MRDVHAGACSLVVFYEQSIPNRYIHQRLVHQLISDLAKGDRPGKRLNLFALQFAVQKIEYAVARKGRLGIAQFCDARVKRVRSIEKPNCEKAWLPVSSFFACCEVIFISNRFLLHDLFSFGKSFFMLCLLVSARQALI